MITDVPGILVGHYTDLKALTGCTVVLCPPKTIASCEVRGSAPGSRELALLAPEKQMQEIHAVLLTGGSAFGLGAANGVMKYLAEKGMGYRTPWALVPIVPSAVIFDLNVGDSTVYPTQDDAYYASANASVKVEQGNVGAGGVCRAGSRAGERRGVAVRRGVGSNRLGLHQRAATRPQAGIAQGAAGPHRCRPRREDAHGELGGAGFDLPTPACGRVFLYKLPENRKIGWQAKAPAPLPLFPTPAAPNADRTIIALCLKLLFRAGAFCGG